MLNWMIYKRSNGQHTHTHTHKVVTRPSWMSHILAACVALFLIGPITYMALDRTPPLVPYIGEMVPNKASPGDTVRIDFTVNVNRQCRGTVHREIVDSSRVVHILESIPSVIRDTEFHVSRRLQIPYNLSWGPARYRVIVHYVCNPLQNWWPIEVRSPDIVFTVVPPDKKD